MSANIIKVAVPTPLRRLFDYRVDDPALKVQCGMRVVVPFGRQKLVGVVWQVGAASDYPLEKLRPIESCLDEAPVVDEQGRALAQWMSRYYHAPLGEILSLMLPVLMRQGSCEQVTGERLWRALPGEAASLARAPSQQAVWQWLDAAGAAVSEDQVREHFPRAATALKALEEKQLVVSEFADCLKHHGQGQAPRVELNEDQRQAVDALAASLATFKPFLLQGVTGSGKTEVYLHIAQQALAQGRQVLVLVPEIALTPQVVQRFEQRLDVPMAVMNSSLTDRQRLCAWQAASSGRARVVLGTRSAIFVPMPELGLVVVDEEHDSSYKQQEGIRYSARDMALVRGQLHSCPVVLGTATPALETLHNAIEGRYQWLRLGGRAGGAKPPAVKLLNISQRKLHEGMANETLQRISQVLSEGHQVMVFINRRGFAPLLQCHDCGWVGECRRCDARMTYHARLGKLRCHHCGHEEPLPQQCPECRSPNLLPIGRGTERVERLLRQRFPYTSIARLDRDSTSRKGALEETLERVRSGQVQLLIGTQMLTKGHDFPDVTLVVVLDADGGLFGQDFRAQEMLAQQLVQVAGRAGRGAKAGEVWVQTHYPEHPLLQHLLRHDYEAFARQVLADRQQTALPPYSHMALLRAEHNQRDRVLGVLTDVAGQLAGVHEDVWVLGPVPAPMERRQGRYRAQLLIQSQNRSALHVVLDRLVTVMEAGAGKQVRWNLDVDPSDLY